MGKYQKILEKKYLDYDDLVTLQISKKLKSAISGIAIVKHGTDTYLRLINPATWELIMDKKESP